MNLHVQMKTAKVDIRRALAILELCPDLDLDEELKLSTLEGETELCEIVSALLAENENDEGAIVAVKEQIAVRRERIDRFERRIEARKSAITSLMDTANITRLALPEATVSLRTLGPRVKITDADQLPSAFVDEVVTLKANMEAIKSAVENGASIPGVVMTNGGASLSVRRK